VGIAAGTVAVCVHAMFVNSLLTTFVMEMLWILWGLVFVMRSTRPVVPPTSEAHLIACCRS